MHFLVHYFFVKEDVGDGSVLMTVLQWFIVKKNVNMTKAGNLGVFVCVCVCEVDRHCVCDMLMLVLGAC